MGVPLRVSHEATFVIPIARAVRLDATFKVVRFPLLPTFLGEVLSHKSFQLYIEIGFGMSGYV